MDQIMINEALSAFDKTTIDLLDTISQFSDEQFNTIPFEGSWTAGQVAEHLLMSETGVANVFAGHSQNANRPADEKVATIEKVFLDFTVKFETSANIMPSNVAKDKATLYSALESNRAKISEMAIVLNLSELCTDAPLRVIGELTRLEWIWFSVAHSSRHIRQMKNIHSYL